MKQLRSLAFIVCVSAGSLLYAQAPVVTVNAQRHGNLADAQDNLVEAYARVGNAQQASRSHLGGHAQRAKELIEQANQEIALAAAQADANQEQSILPGAVPRVPSQPVDVTGKWTIYAYNVSKPGSSLKQVELVQDGNVVSGKFRGPNQKGKLQGWINGNHIEFSTDTNDVLTFRGEITASGMSGMYGIHGEHAPFKAQRE